MKDLALKLTLGLMVLCTACVCLQVIAEGVERLANLAILMQGRTGR